VVRHCLCRLVQWHFLLAAALIVVACGRVGFPPQEVRMPPDAGADWDSGPWTAEPPVCPGELMGDTDEDEVCDSLDDCRDTPNRDQLDTDGDGLGDACDDDDDDDGEPDAADRCPLDDPDDSDEDGVCDSDDRCPDFADADDADMDGVPDGCDLPTCGDGMLEPELGETCDSSSASDACPLDCDDADVCTSDVQLGDPDACNLECTNPVITEFQNDDGCCPPGANAFTDLDCPPRCGNGVAENGEQCDGGSLCNPDCTKTDQARCLDADDAQSPSCEACSCDYCVEPTLECVYNADPQYASHCQEVMHCARVHGCRGDACFCGTSSNCWQSSNGPCKSEITAAAAYRNMMPYDCYNDPECAKIFAGGVADCIRSNCDEECW
jgi:hypothetical protein